MNEIINLGNGALVKVCMLKGQQGDDIQSIAKTGTDVLVDTYTITLTDGSTHTFTVTNGKGISSITKTDTTGLVDTYTITFNDESTTTFTVTNGNGIASVEKTATNVLVDTYTITFTNNTTTTFTVTNGKGISSIAKTATSGLVDTYTITFNDGTTQTFDVTNGANGQDVSQSNLAPVEETSTTSQSYIIGDLLVFNGQLYEVTQAIAQGASLQIGVNIQTTSISEAIEKIQNYSSNDTIIGYWIDGKPIHRKVVQKYNDGTYLTVGANKQVRTTGFYGYVGKKIINSHITFADGSGSNPWKQVAPTRFISLNDESNISQSSVKWQVDYGWTEFTSNSILYLYIANFQSVAQSFYDFTIIFDYVEM